MASRTPGPTRSLRRRVATAAASGTVVLAVVVAVVVSVLLARREEALLDQRLDVVATVVAARVAAGAGADEVLRQGTPLLRAALSGLVVTVRTGGDVGSAGLGATAPDLPARTGDAGGYRVETRAVPGGIVSVGLPTRSTDRTVARVRQVAALVALLAGLAAAGLGWVLAGPALRPLHELRERTAALGGRPGPAERDGLTAPPVDGTRETAELATALAGLVDRVARARADGERSLASARDFAVAAEHELRTPLTAMGTGIDVLRAHPGLPAGERAAVLDELTAAQARITTTLTALTQLASGDLRGGADGDGDGDGVELTDLVASAVAAAQRLAPAGVVVDHELPAGDVRVPGSPTGVRLAVDNLLVNALRHAGGTRVVATLTTTPGGAVITVDDDGRGVPPEEREAVFERFRRGRQARSPGSGLGLALVAQQAGLHRGAARMEPSHLGGARAVLELPAHGSGGH